MYIYNQSYLKLDPLIGFLRLLLRDTCIIKPYTKVKSDDLSNIHDNNVMPRCKVSSDLLKWIEDLILARSSKTTMKSLTNLNEIVIMENIPWYTLEG